MQSWFCDVGAGGTNNKKRLTLIILSDFAISIDALHNPPNTFYSAMILTAAFADIPMIVGGHDVHELASIPPPVLPVIRRFISGASRHSTNYPPPHVMVIEPYPVSMSSCNFLSCPIWIVHALSIVWITKAR